MAAITAPNPGQAIIAFTKAMRNAEGRYNEMQNCRSCDKEVAAQWRRDAEFFKDLILQLEKHT